ncbi:MAG: NCS1 family transporter [Paracoccus sp. (in: a-proteobacteria)]|uniref:NCS1 family transporter n=1 Tax=Rhodobacterales TaxID=204455 RepID=UPI000C5FF613|nr:NCS1 family transporter [Paracoccus sp. (in: a-proteobacteria)]MBA49030.1 transporter [Paracoccus sp. (in: a-proteobacteria)]|tara:strand:+ start:606 stop:1961 length:1356 start_codon:yes stop_codon:yes gene_type:complete
MAMNAEIDASHVDTLDQKAIGEESLAPQTTRIMDPWSYLFAWLGGCVSIGTFTVGSGLVGTLNLLQTFVAIGIGCLVIGVALTINGQAGHKYGIPFMVQARSAFGFTGSRIPALVRSVPAIVWFGFQSWIGAGALNLVSATMFGYDNIVVFFVGFQFLQIGLSVLGFHGIKWLENIGSIFIIGALIYMFYSVISKYGDEISTNLVNVEGTWGAPFWGATMLFLGIYSTMMLNVSDYSRELRHNVGPFRQVVIYSNSIFPATLFMGLIGLMVSGATGEVDPIKVFSSAMDNTFLLVVTLLFIAFAQVTTNILNNVVPPAYALMDVFKLKFRTSAILVGLLAFSTFPWELVKDESAAGLNLFIQTYSAFLGPIFAILVVDYFVLRRQKLDLDKLYDADGPYKGINWAAVIAMAIGVVVALIFSGISWYASLIPAGLAYWLLMRSMPSARRFAS